MQVVEVIRSLEEHQKKCENEGNYMAAQSAVQRLHGIKVSTYRVTFVFTQRTQLL